MPAVCTYISEKTADYQPVLSLLLCEQLRDPGQSLLSWIALFAVLCLRVCTFIFDPEPLWYPVFVLTLFEQCPFHCSQIVWVYRLPLLLLLSCRFFDTVRWVRRR